MVEDELIEQVIQLIDTKKGDIGRLNYILSTLQEGRSLYTSDRKYLESLITTYLGGTGRVVSKQQSVEELRSELARVKSRLERYERRGYKKAIGRKAVFFFITFFFGWHAVTQLVNQKFLHDMQNTNQYLFPLYQLKLVIPNQVTTIMTQYNLSVDNLILLVWVGMMITWVILGFIYLVKFIRSRYNPAIQ